MQASTAFHSASDEGVLLKLFQQLRLDQLRALPPLSVPRCVIDSVGDPAKRMALQRLDARATGDSATPAAAPTSRARDAALAATERASTKGANALRTGMRTLRQTARHNGCGSFEWGQELEAVRDVATDLAAAVDGLGAISETLAQGGGEGNARMTVAASRLPEVISDAHAALADYHRLEIRLAHDAMRARRADCELEARRYLDGAKQVQALRRRLSRGWLGRVVGGHKLTRAERARLEQRLQRLTERQQRHHVFVEGDEIQRWLDTLVEAAHYLPPEEWEEEARDARFIAYQLLNIHCLQGEMAAEDLAVGLILRKDAHERLEPDPRTRAFIERYFESRRRDDGRAQARAMPAVEARFTRARALTLAEYGQPG